MPRHSRPEGAVRILHAITGTGVGGAQNMLAKLMEAREGVFDPYEQCVVSLTPAGELKSRFERAGAIVHSLGMRSGLPTPGAAIRLFRTTRKFAPDLLVGWMHHAGIAAYLAAGMLRPRRPLIWNVRHSLSDLAHEKFATRTAIRLQVSMSSKVQAIIYNSGEAKAQYAALGFDARRSIVIPNGFDCEHYAPRNDARDRLRSIFGIGDNTPIIGMIARNHPMKDVGTLVEAVRRLRQSGTDVHLLIVGPDMPDLPKTLPGVAGQDWITISGQRFDIAEWLPGLDAFVLSSAWGEAFPNVLGEAMASGVPCVATDVGDARWIVGKSGRIVPVRDPDAMRSALAEIIDLAFEARNGLGQEARQRIIQLFSLKTVAKEYADLYRKVLDEAETARTFRSSTVVPSLK